MWGISKVLKIREKPTRQVQKPQIVNIFCDLQSTINNLRQCNIGTGWKLRLQVYQNAKKLVERGYSIFIKQILGHNEEEENERVDKTARETASGRRVQTVK